MKGADSDVSMTAFCLIAIQESRAYCNDTVEVSMSPIYRVFYPPIFINSLMVYFLNTKKGGHTCINAHKEKSSKYQHLEMKEASSDVLG